MTCGYTTKQHHIPTKRYCRMLDLRNDPKLIAMYRDCHSQSKHWQEIREGIREIGILEMEIYILENHLFMIVDTPLDFEWETSMAQLSTLPRQQEWEEFVAAFQQCATSDTADSKWKMMERMFYLYE